MGFKRRDFLSSTLGIGAGLGLLNAGGCSDSNNNFRVADPDDNPQVEPTTTQRLHFNLDHVGDLPGPLTFGTAGRRAPVLPHDEDSLAEYAGTGEPTYYADIVPPSKVTMGWITHHHPDSTDGQHDWVHLRLLFPPPADSESAGAAMVRAAAHCSVVTDINASSGPEDIALALAFHHPELMSLDADEATQVACHLTSLPELLDAAEEIKTLGRASETGGWATLVPIEKDDPQPGDGLYYTKTVADGSTEKIYNIQISDQLTPSLQALIGKAMNLVKADATLPNKKYQTAPNSQVTASTRQPFRQHVSAAAHGFTMSADYKAGHYQHGIEWLEIEVLDVEERKIRVKVRNHSFRFFSLYAEFLDAEGAVINVEEIRDDWAEYFFPQAALVSDGLKNGLEGKGRKYLRLVSAVPTILGIPVTGPGIEDLADVRMPDNATAVRFMFGTAGATGRYTDGPVPVVGLLVTIIAQFIIPTILLLLTLGEDDDAPLFKLFIGPLAFTLLSLLLSLDILAFGALWDALTDPEDVQDNAEIRGQNMLNTLLGDLTILATVLSKALLAGGLAALSEWLIEKTSEEELEDAIPFFGIAYKMTSIAVTEATMIQTTTQLMTNPPVMDNHVRLSQDVTVAIHHDLDDFQFPATATHYELQLTLDKAAPYNSGLIKLPDTTVSDALSYTFSNIPSGSRFHVSAIFYADGAGGIVGSGHAARYFITKANLESLRQEYNDPSLPLPLPAITDEVYNKLLPKVGFFYPDTPSLVAMLNDTLGEDDASTYRKHIALRTARRSINNALEENGEVTVECTIQERLITLTENSSYQHKQRLVLQNGDRVWQAGAAGTGTLFDLSQGTSDGDISVLGSSSLSQRTGQFAYSWRSAAGSLPECGSNVGNIQLYQIQTVSLTQNPQSGWHRALTEGADCGQTDKMSAVFELLGSTSGDGNNFAVSSEQDANGRTRHFVRRISAATDGSIELSGDAVVGEFVVPPDSLTLHPAGYLLATSVSNHKLQVLPLPADNTQTFPRDRAPRASIFGGRGALPGMLAGPVVVRASLRGHIYILESLNRRIQVFDTSGQPRRLPRLRSASTISLEATGDDVTLLDMGVDAAEYVYLLGYTGSGGSPNDFVLDVYDDTGVRLFRHTGMNAGRMTVDLWRNIYTVNYERLLLDDGRAEPSISLWIPFTPA